MSAIEDNEKRGDESPFGRPVPKIESNYEDDSARDWTAEEEKNLV